MNRRVKIHIGRLTLDRSEWIGQTALQTALAPVIEAAVQARMQDRKPSWPAGSSPALRMIGTRVHAEMAGAAALQHPRKMEP